MPDANRILRVRRSLNEIGIARTLIRIVRKIYRRAIPARIPTHPFDLQYSLDTSGYITARKLTSGHPHDVHITGYWGTAPSLFKGVVHQWIQTLPAVSLAPEDYCLIDIGCGKGRVVMLASDFPFRRIVGVELNRALIETAKRNLAKWQSTHHSCSDIEVLNGDALDVPIPDSPTVVYLFNPFDAHATQLLLDRIQAVSVARSTPIDFLYVHAEYAQLFAQVPNMQLLWEGEIPFTPEDMSADFVHTSQQDCHIYRLTPPSHAIDHGRLDRDPERGGEGWRVTRSNRIE